MAKSREIFDKLGRLLEKGILNTKDISNEFINICKSKRDEFIFHMKLTSKEETEIINKRLDKLEKKIIDIEKKKPTKKPKKVKKP